MTSKSIKFLHDTQMVELSAVGPNETVLDYLRFKVMLGENECSEVAIREFRWRDAICDQYYLNDGCLCVDICEEGGKRLIQITDETLKLNARSPENGIIDINYSLNENVNSSVRVFDLFGRNCRIFNSSASGDYYKTVEGLAQGVYFVLLTTESYSLTVKVMVH